MDSGHGIDDRPFDVTFHASPSENLVLYNLSYKWDFCRVNPLKSLGWTNPLTIRGMNHQVYVDLHKMTRAKNSTFCHKEKLATPSEIRCFLLGSFTMAWQLRTNRNDEQMLFAGVQPPVKTLGSWSHYDMVRRPWRLFPGFHNWLVVSNMFYVPFHIWDVILPC